MERMATAIITAILLFHAGTGLSSASIMELAEPPVSTPAMGSALEPEYARWGRLAMKETAGRYQADIVDYKYEGKYPLNSGTFEERFKLWLRKDGREFGVRVRISVATGSDEFESIAFDEITG
ncbi:DUF3889 domain-containing protein [Paenibacillus sp. NPDC058071]|uniref:DUF3889 domain-containing protein n=1 Tax=Paenibacillus sp. NPDC058071 TaxID=3346326 RepID=UPI0036DC4422